MEYLGSLGDPRACGFEMGAVEERGEYMNSPMKGVGR